jgi:hypothetical protein
LQKDQRIKLPTVCCDSAREFATKNQGKTILQNDRHPDAGPANHEGSRMVASLYDRGYSTALI